MFGSSADADAPVLRESRTEYLLYVPYDLRHQARRIEGRRWDPVRKCWAFPKTPRSLADLRLEFGDALIPEPVGSTRKRLLRIMSSAWLWVGLVVALAIAVGAWRLM